MRYLIIHLTNNFGPYQHIEKLIPMTIFKIIHKQKIPIYGNGLNIRDWLYVKDTSKIIFLIIKFNLQGNICIGGNNEHSNKKLIEIILKNFKKINSNFNCGFYIDRERLNYILKDTYHVETAYDPCSYPGVKCKYYYNHLLDENKQTGLVSEEDRNMKMSELGNNKKYTEVSFMVFRTGSCLIVGNCTEPVLRKVYEFIKNILLNEYTKICIPNEEPITKIKKEKVRKKNITVTLDYYREHIMNIKPTAT